MPQQAKDGAGKREIAPLREVVLRLEAERPGQLEAQAEALPIRITAPTLEELQHQAREGGDAHLGLDQQRQQHQDGGLEGQNLRRGERPERDQKHGGLTAHPMQLASEPCRGGGLHRTSSLRRADLPALLAVSARSLSALPRLSSSRGPSRDPDSRPLTLQ